MEVFQMDNSTKHTTIFVTKRLKDKTLDKKLLERAFVRQFTILTQFCQEERAKISENFNEKFVEGHQKCLTQVLNFEGTSTKN